MPAIPMRFKTLLLSGWTFALDIVYPPRCGGCDRRGTLLCDDCRLSVVEPVHTGREVDGIDLVICAGAFLGPLRTAIHNLKYESDTPLARPLASLLSDALSRDENAELDGDAPVLVPVPLHPQRRKLRGFNQAELLALELSRLTGWSISRDLRRTKNTRSQVGLNAEERRDNMRDAFVWEGSVPPQRVLLVDDVCTTGATLSECAATLRRHGAREVYAVTVGKALGKGADAGS